MLEVSINSTSEEVRRGEADKKCRSSLDKFPLIQLPKKSEDYLQRKSGRILRPGFPLIQLPKKSEGLYDYPKFFWEIICFH